jgi:MFS family permease
MLGVYGVGAVSGAWISSWLTAKTEPAALLAGLVVAGVSGIGIWLAPAFWIVLACNLAWGVGDGVTRVAKVGIFQRRIPDAVRGRVVAATESVVHLALMTGFIAAGPAVAILGAKATYAVTGLAALGSAGLVSTVIAAARREAAGAGTKRVDPPVTPVV